MAAGYSTAAVSMGHLALKRTIRHAEANDLISRNVATLTDTPHILPADSTREMNGDPWRVFMRGYCPVLRTIWLLVSRRGAECSNTSCISRYREYPVVVVQRREPRLSARAACLRRRSGVAQAAGPAWWLACEISTSYDPSMYSPRSNYL
jgi:hypothetical protein